MADPKLLPILQELFSRVSTMSLATVDDAGRPHAVNLNFVADDDCNLYFISDPGTAHAKHIAARPDVAATVYAPFEHPSQIHGVQLHGVCAVEPADRFEDCWGLYCAKFEYAPQFEERARSERFYKVTPRWVRSVDNSVHFGFKLEAEWSQDV